MNKYDITGEKFGHWTVIGRDFDRPTDRNTYWLCKCDCGEIRSITRTSIVSGKSKSCGCMRGEHLKGINKTHGMSKTRIYHEWASMRKRCKSENDRCASSYYLRGITVCPEWDSDFMAFYEWAMDNGYNDSLTIDRIDNGKGYSPDNCRWITIEQQQSNKRNTVFVEYQGEKWCLRTLCENIGFPYKTAHRRYMRMTRRGEPITTDKLIAPIDESKIPFRYRKS